MQDEREWSEAAELSWTIGLNGSRSLQSKTGTMAELVQFFQTLSEDEKVSAHLDVESNDAAQHFASSKITELANELSAMSR